MMLAVQNYYLKYIFLSVNYLMIDNSSLLFIQLYMHIVFYVYPAAQLLLSVSFMIFDCRIFMFVIC